MAHKQLPDPPSFPGSDTYCAMCNERIENLETILFPICGTCEPAYDQLSGEYRAIMDEYKDRMDELPREARTIYDFSMVMLFIQMHNEGLERDLTAYEAWAQAYAIAMQPRGRKPEPKRQWVDEQRAAGRDRASVRAAFLKRPDVQNLTDPSDIFRKLWPKGTKNRK